MPKHAQTQALRSQTRSVRGTQKKLKIFESSWPRQLLKLACTGLHLPLAKCLIVWDALHGKDKDGKHREAYVWHTMVRNALLKSWGIDMVDVLFLVCLYVFSWSSWSSPSMSRRALTQALRSQTRSVSGTQKKSKIFENSCPRQLLKLACTGLHLQCLIMWETLHGKDGKLTVLRV